MFTNISAYRFAPLTDLKPLRALLLEQCKRDQLKGTILLSTEGINLFVAGSETAIERLVGVLRTLPGLSDLTPKVSLSESQPFTRMLVRIKKEIIAFGVDGIDPGKRTSPKLPARELKAWLDEGREMTLLDTRNEYEIRLGTFRGAKSVGIEHFRDFPKASAALPDDLKQKPLVMFCTGGIRCEKAGPYLESIGFKSVFQLDGGILKYFEECGNTHYDGDCFVFDQRVGVDPSLQETSNANCFVCLTPLTAEEQQDVRYVKGVSCVYCFQSSDDRMRESIAARHAAIAKVCDPLPGAEPYIHYRPLKVPAKYAGKTVREFLSLALKHVPDAEWETEFACGRICAADRQPVDPNTRVSAGERYFHQSTLQSEPPINPQIRILYEDEVIVVLEKPAPLPVHPCGRFNRNTLQSILEKVYAPQKPHPAHRLDANTTGLLVVARTKRFASLLQPQFATGEVEKRYLALVHGHPAQDVFDCDLALSEETEHAGARRASDTGLASRTEFRVLKRNSDGTALIEARPITGRTNQIRIHLWELGFPIVGDQLYLPGKRLGNIQTGAVEDAPLCLPAKSLSFLHPLTRERVTFESELLENKPGEDFKQHWAQEGKKIEARAHGFAS